MKRVTLARRIRVVGIASVSAAAMCITVTTGCQSSKFELLGAPGVPRPYLAPVAREAKVIEAPPGPEIVPMTKEPKTGLVPPPNKGDQPEIIVVEPDKTTEPPTIKTAKPPTEATASTLTYALKKGETVWHVSLMYGVSMKNLLDYNNLTEEQAKKLPVGQVIKLPPGAKFVPENQRPKPKQTKSPSPAPTGTQTSSRNPDPGLLTHKFKGSEPVPNDGKYVVQPGDSLWKIAQRFGLSIQGIMDSNNLKDQNIFPKQTLVLKGEAARTTARTPAPDAAKPPADNTGGTQAQPREQPPAAGAPADVAKMKKFPHYCDPGDTLKSIAAMYDSKVEWIQEANPAVKSDADLKANMKIEVPVQEN